MRRAAGVLFLMLAARAAAHPISVTQADAVVSGDKLRVALELFVEDLFLFHGLEPDEEGNLRPGDIRKAVEKHKTFLLERFEVRNVEGAPLAGRVAQVDECEIPEEGIPVADLMAHSLVYHLEYPMDAPPEFLTFTQSLGNTSFGFPAQMLLRLKQEDSAAPYMAELRSSEPLTIRLDRDNPPPPPDAPIREWEDWERKRKESALGITSYSSVYSFLYIEEFEVRHEILAPLLTIEASIPIERADPDYLDVAEQDAARPAIAALFAGANPIRIDGIRVEPTVDRIDFYGLDFKDFAQRSDRRRVSMANARVGVILVYSTKGAPASVEATWDLFNKFLWGSQTTVYAFDRTTQVFFSPYQKTYAWKSPGRAARPPIESVSVATPPAPRWNVPALSASFLAAAFLAAGLVRRLAAAAAILIVGTLLAAAALPVGRIDVSNPFAPAASVSDEEAKGVLETLQRNVYRAFDYPEDRQVYDALARSIAGPLLEKTYLDVKASLVMREQGGAKARVTNVALVDARRLPLERPGADPRAFRMSAVWTVAGAVEHWGHVHERLNEYEATFTVEPREDAWKIVAMDVTREDRLRFTTRLRGAETTSTASPADASGPAGEAVAAGEAAPAP